MAIPINRYGNCTTDLKGSGSMSCDLTSFGDIMGFALHPKGFGFLTGGTLSETEWKNAIKDFNAIPFVGVYDFTQDTPENETATSSTGVMSTIRSGKPQFSFSFDRGGCFHKALYDKRGKNRWDLSIIFETGILMALTGTGVNEKVVGFDMGNFDVDTFRLQQGTDPQQSTARIQLIDANQFNTEFVFLTWAELGANLSRVEGIIDAVVTLVDSALPTEGGTTFAVKVTGSCNQDNIVFGLDDNTQWRLGGTQATPKTVTIAAYRPATQDYLLTVSSAFAENDTVQPTLATTTYDVATDDLGNMYKGKLVSAATVEAA